MLIALFGGTFDPPHKGHELVADTLIDKNIVDEVWFVPVFEHPWASRYQKQLSSYENRTAMIELTVGEKPHQKIAHYKSVSYTFDTLRYFSQQFPANSFSWVMGSEYLTKFEDFLADHPQLMEYPFIIYPREGYDSEPVYGNMLLLDEMPTVKISSTEVRDRLAANQEINNLVSSQVVNYINTHKGMYEK